MKTEELKTILANTLEKAALTPEEIDYALDGCILKVERGGKNEALKKALREFAQEALDEDEDSYRNQKTFIIAHIDPEDPEKITSYSTIYLKKFDDNSLMLHHASLSSRREDLAPFEEALKEVAKEVKTILVEQEIGLIPSEKISNDVLSRDSALGAVYNFARIFGATAEDLLGMTNSEENPIMLVNSLSQDGEVVDMSSFIDENRVKKIAPKAAKSHPTGITGINPKKALGALASTLVAAAGLETGGRDSAESSAGGLLSFSYETTEPVSIDLNGTDANYAVGYLDSSGEEHYLTGNAQPTKIPGEFKCGVFTINIAGEKGLDGVISVGDLTLLKVANLFLPVANQTETPPNSEDIGCTIAQELVEPARYYEPILPEFFSNHTFAGGVAPLSEATGIFAALTKSVDSEGLNHRYFSTFASADGVQLESFDLGNDMSSQTLGSQIYKMDNGIIIVISLQSDEYGVTRFPSINSFDSTGKPIQSSASFVGGGTDCIMNFCNTQLVKDDVDNYYVRISTFPHGEDSSLYKISPDGSCATTYSPDTCENTDWMTGLTVVQPITNCTTSDGTEVSSNSTSFNITRRVVSPIPPTPTPPSHGGMGGAAKAAIGSTVGGLLAIAAAITAYFKCKGGHPSADHDSYASLDELPDHLGNAEKGTVVGAGPATTLEDEFTATPVVGVELLQKGNLAQSNQ